MSRLPMLAGAAIGAGFLFVSAAAAQSPDVALLAAPCANCHGTDGRSPGPIVPIAGRPETVLRAQLKAFKADPPPAGTTIMNRIAKGYSDEQLDALATYFSRISAKPPASTQGKK